MPPELHPAEELHQRAASPGGEEQGHGRWADSRAEQAYGAAPAGDVEKLTETNQFNAPWWMRQPSDKASIEPLWRKRLGPEEDSEPLPAESPEVPLVRQTDTNAMPSFAHWSRSTLISKANKNSFEEGCRGLRDKYPPHSFELQPSEDEVQFWLHRSSSLAPQILPSSGLVGTSRICISRLHQPLTVLQRRRMSKLLTTRPRWKGPGRL